jgi:hypothetical protein
MNCAIHSATAKKRRVCGVHNGTDLELRDIPADNIDLSERAQNIRHRSSGRSRRQSPAYFVGRSFVPDDNAIKIPLPTN